jgi:hypothetical protein
MGTFLNLLSALGKMDLLVQISISPFLKKSYGRSYCEFSEPGFPRNFAKNDRQDQKLGCIDASRRQLQSVRNYGSFGFAGPSYNFNCIFPKRIF